MKDIYRISIFPPADVDKGDIVNFNGTDVVVAGVETLADTHAAIDLADKFGLLKMSIRCMEWMIEKGYTLPLTSEQEVEFKLRWF